MLKGITLALFALAALAGLLLCVQPDWLTLGSSRIIGASLACGFAGEFTSRML